MGASGETHGPTAAPEPAPAREPRGDAPGRGGGFARLTCISEGGNDGGPSDAAASVKSAPVAPHRPALPPAHPAHSVVGTRAPETRPALSCGSNEKASEADKWNPEDILSSPPSVCLSRWKQSGPCNTSHAVLLTNGLAVEDPMRTEACAATGQDNGRIQVGSIQCALSMGAGTKAGVGHTSASPGITSDHVLPPDQDRMVREEDWVDAIFEDALPCSGCT